MQAIAKRIVVGGAGLVLLVTSSLALSTLSNSALAQTALTTPAGVIAKTNANTGSVEVTWNAVPGANLYEVLRGKDQSQSGPTPVGVVTKPMFTDNSIGLESDVFYVVRALQGDLESGLSTPASLAIGGPVRPERDSILDINDSVIAGDGSIELQLLNGNLITIDSDTVSALIFAFTEPSEELIELKLRQLFGLAGPNLVPTVAAACLLIPENTYLVTDAALTVDSEEGLIAAAECVDIAPAADRDRDFVFQLPEGISATAELPSQVRASPTQ